MVEKVEEAAEDLVVFRLQEDLETLHEEVKVKL